MLLARAGFLGASTGVTDVHDGGEGSVGDVYNGDQIESLENQAELTANKQTEPRRQTPVLTVLTSRRLLAISTRLHSWCPNVH